MVTPLLGEVLTTEPLVAACPVIAAGTSLYALAAQKAHIPAPMLEHLRVLDRGRADKEDGNKALMPHPGNLL